MTKYTDSEYARVIVFLVNFVDKVTHMRKSSHAFRIFTFVAKWSPRGFLSMSRDIAYKLDIPAPSCRRTIAKLFHDGVLRETRRLNLDNNRMVIFYHLALDADDIREIMQDSRFKRFSLTSIDLNSFADWLEMISDKEEWLKQVNPSPPENDTTEESMQKLAALFG